MLCLALGANGVADAFITAPERHHYREYRQELFGRNSEPELEERAQELLARPERAVREWHLSLISSATRLWCAAALAVSVAIYSTALPSPAAAETFDVDYLYQPQSQQTARISFGSTNVNSNGDVVENDDDERPPQPKRSRYYTIQQSGTREEIMAANEALMDHAVGVISTIYYDKTAGAYFTPRDLYDKWRALRAYAKGGDEALSKLKEQDSTKGVDRMTWMRGANYRSSPMPEDALGSRENVIKGLKWIVSTLDDPYSSYQTREELWDETHKRSDGFLGTGAFVEVPRGIFPTTSWFHTTGNDPQVDRSVLHKNPMKIGGSSSNANGKGKSNQIMSRTRADNLPIVTAIVPNSPAERAGIAVGDRIISVGSDKFVGNREHIESKLKKRYSASNYIGYPDLTIAKPTLTMTTMDTEAPREKITGYRKIHVSLPTALVEPYRPYYSQSQISGGDSIVNYQLLTGEGSIFQRLASLNELNQPQSGIGYIRMTRFSRSATIGFTNAVAALETAGAQAYIIDLRNCYGGVIQEAMITASSLLRDPKSVLCYTIDTRGGFTPHIVEDFVADARYPGYLLSSEPTSATLDQVRKASHGQEDSTPKDSILWVPQTSYASLRVQGKVKGLHLASTDAAEMTSEYNRDASSPRSLYPKQRFVSKYEQKQAQKPIVILINEGTASSAEMFTAALKDNGRVTAVVGRRSFGKGLVQHNVPLPDGGALRLTIAEYLTPRLKHVTSIGQARYDSATGELVGGGIRPTVYCPTNSGIPYNVGADICVGIGIDALNDAGGEYNSVSL